MHRRPRMPIFWDWRKLIEPDSPLWTLAFQELSSFRLLLIDAEIRTSKALPLEV